MPAIRPSTYNYSPGEYTNSTPNFRGIIEYPNPLTNETNRDRLSLRFDGMSDDETEEFFSEYDLSAHGVFPVLLADEYLEGIDDAELVAAIIGAGTVPQWYYREAPAITGTDAPGIHDVKLEFERMIEVPWFDSM
jgi:hypothetical protein